MRARVTWIVFPLNVLLVTSLVMAACGGGNGSNQPSAEDRAACGALRDWVSHYQQAYQDFIGTTGAIGGPAVDANLADAVRSAANRSTDAELASLGDRLASAARTNEELIFSLEAFHRIVGATNEMADVCTEIGVPTDTVIDPFAD